MKRKGPGQEWCKNVLVVFQLATCLQINRKQFNGPNINVLQFNWPLHQQKVGEVQSMWTFKNALQINCSINQLQLIFSTNFRHCFPKFNNAVEVQNMILIKQYILQRYFVEVCTASCNICVSVQQISNVVHRCVDVAIIRFVLQVNQ